MHIHIPLSLSFLLRSLSSSARSLLSCARSPLASCALSSFALSLSQDIKAFDSSSTRFQTLEELFPPTTTVFMVGNPYYGTMGEVCTALLPV